MEHSRVESPKTRKSTVVIEPLQDKRQTDLRLFLVPLVLPGSDAKPPKAKQVEIVSIHSDSDSDSADLVLQKDEELPRPESIAGAKRKFDSLVQKPEKYSSPVETSKQVKKQKRSPPESSRESKPLTLPKKRLSPLTPKQNIPQLNHLASLYRKITGFNTSHPPQRIIEEYYRFSYLRNDPKQKWGSYEFYHTFTFLQKLCKGNDKAYANGIRFFHVLISKQRRISLLFN